MNILEIGIGVFVFIEFLNIFVLYFMPESKMGNGVGVFDDYHRLNDDHESNDFVGYLINWVAGAKLIFIMIGIVVIIFGNYHTQLFTVVALILSILSFYWRLFPTILKLDKAGKISPKGYSKTLNFMIMSFLIGFGVILIFSLL
ncbi:MAG: hypothetical protein KJ847_00165 [Firmicutes bacterium]|nr:hypothetical protein [Bacillota bacterium]